MFHAVYIVRLVRMPENDKAHVRTVLVDFIKIGIGKAIALHVQAEHILEKKVQNRSTTVFQSADMAHFHLRYLTFFRIVVVFNDNVKIISSRNKQYLAMFMQGLVPCLECPRNSFSGEPPTGGYKDCQACPANTFTFQPAAPTKDRCRSKCAPGLCCLLLHF